MNSNKLRLLEGIIELQSELGRAPSVREMTAIFDNKYTRQRVNQLYIELIEEGYIERIELKNILLKQKGLSELIKNKNEQHKTLSGLRDQS